MWDFAWMIYVNWKYSTHIPVPRETLSRVFFRGISSLLNEINEKSDWKSNDSSINYDYWKRKTLQSNIFSNRSLYPKKIIMAQIIYKSLCSNNASRILWKSQTGKNTSVYDDFRWFFVLYAMPFPVNIKDEWKNNNS